MGGRPSFHQFAAAPWVRWAAFFWGLAIFMPVGMHYLALLLLLAATVAQGDLKSRFSRLKSSPIRWPLTVFGGWTLFVLVLMPHDYPQTVNSLAHTVRIVVVLVLVSMLNRDEALGAIRGFVVAVGVALALIALDRGLGLPQMSAWENLVHYLGNKSIANSILLAMAGAACLIAAAQLQGRMRVLLGAVGIACAAAIVWVLPSQGSQILIVLLLLVGFAHWGRSELRKAMLATALCVAFLGTTAAFLPEETLVSRYLHEFSRITQPSTGTTHADYSSWEIRWHFYRLTSEMIIERPLAGWGIGAWGTQWALRAPAGLEMLSAPHNDYLWIGAQSGLIGLLSFGSLMFAGILTCWKRNDLLGSLGMVFTTGMAFSLLIHSALRDAAIGMSVGFLTAAALQLVITEPRLVTHSSRS